MRAELKRLQQELGITFVHVTHCQEEAMALADLMVVMNDGRIEQAGSPREVFNAPRTEFVARFIGGHNVIAHAAAARSRCAPTGCALPRAGRAAPAGAPRRCARVEYQGTLRAGQRSTATAADELTAIAARRRVRRRAGRRPATTCARRLGRAADAHPLAPEQALDPTRARRTRRPTWQTTNDRRAELQPPRAAQGRAPPPAGARRSAPSPACRRIAQDPITLRYLGTGGEPVKAIAEKCKEDTGITIAVHRRSPPTT